jgi:streptomycin 6-kinase
MSAFTLPSTLAEAVERERSPERWQWLAELPGTVAELARRWSLVLGPPFQPGGEVAWVAPARNEAGHELVLKVGWRHYEGEHEAAGLRAWRGRGAVTLHAEHTEDRTSALLLARCRPGTPLGELCGEPEQDVVITRLLRGLWHEPPPGHPFRPLAQLCDAWADEFDRDYAAAPDVLDPGLARAGMRLFRSLPRDHPGPPQLLVTDLHAGNVLAAGEQRWLVIDPKPYLGDPCYDLLQHMLNAEELDDPGARADRLAELAGLDAERVRLWLFARAVQEGVRQPWLRPVAAALAPR